MIEPGGVACISHVTPPARARIGHAEPHPRRRGGFSLLGFSIALFVISLLAALVTPAVKRALRHARSAATVDDLRAFATAFQNYAHARGDWPASTGVPAEIPTGMQNYLSTAWERPTPIGGFYTWATYSLQKGDRYRAVLLLSPVGAHQVSADRQQLTDIDRQIDDGNLATGNFLLGYRNQPFFVIEH